MTDELDNLPSSDGGGGEGAFTPTEYRSWFERLADGLSYVGLWFAMIAVLVMIALTTADMLLRNVAGRTLMIAEELVGQLVVAMAFFGVAYALRRHTLLRVEMFRERLSPRAGVVVDVCFGLASLAYVGLLVWFGMRLVGSSLRLNVVSLSPLQTPMWIPQLVIPVGGGMLALALIAEQLRDLRRLRTVWRQGGRS